MKFWLNEISKFNGQHIWPKPSAVRVVYSNASATGYRDYTVEHDTMVATGQWSMEDALQSSTWCELRAVRQVLESFQLNWKMSVFAGLQIIKMWCILSSMVAGSRHCNIVQYGSRQ